MRIGIIGCGHIGSTLARLWSKAGYEVILSTDHPEKLKSLAKELGPNASVGTPEDAARKGEIILLSIPLGEIPKLSNELKKALQGKVVIDTCNPYPERDGKAATEALKEKNGSGFWTSHQLPGAIIVKAFNTVHSQVLEQEAHRKKEAIGVPVASDDKRAIQTVSKLIRDAGFGPVVVGELKTCKSFDVGTPPYGSDGTVSQVEELLDLRAKTR